MGRCFVEIKCCMSRIREMHCLARLTDSLIVIKNTVRIKDSIAFRIVIPLSHSNKKIICTPKSQLINEVLYAEMNIAFLPTLSISETALLGLCI